MIKKEKMKEIEKILGEQRYGTFRGDVVCSGHLVFWRSLISLRLRQWQIEIHLLGEGMSLAEIKRLFPSQAKHSSIVLSRPFCQEDRPRSDFIVLNYLFHPSFRSIPLSVDHSLGQTSLSASWSMFNSIRCRFFQVFQSACACIGCIVYVIRTFISPSCFYAVQVSGYSCSFAVHWTFAAFYAIHGLETHP